MALHALFDILAFVAAWLGHRWARPLLVTDRARAIRSSADYRAALIFGAAIGAFGLGTANLWLSGQAGIGRSIEGALFGAIIAIELFKKLAGITTRTGAGFVLPLAIGIAVGRIGCLLAGLEDFTYGVPTGAGWGWDFGDGVLRYPVQLFESLAMAGYALVYGWQLRRGRGGLFEGGFGLVVAFYGAQRFCVGAFQALC